MTSIDLPSAGVKLLLIACAALTLATCFYYPGNVLAYVAFSFLANGLLFLGLRRDSIFFDFFIGALFWLGFWLKFSLRMMLTDGKFHVYVGRSFDYSAAAYDHALAVASCGMAALMVVRLLRVRFLFTYPENAGTNGLDGLREAYQRHRGLFWGCFGALILVVAVSNAYFGIYQRGMTPRTALPFGLGGIYTWLLLFGGASLSAVMLDLELRLNRAIPYVVVLLVLLETFASNVSMLSRGMILNTGALIVGVYAVSILRRIDFKLSRVTLAATTALVLVVASMLLVKSVRIEEFNDQPVNDSARATDADRASRAKTEANTERLAQSSTLLFLDRWVGIEGVMAVSSYPHLGWNLFKEAWRERYLTRGATLYDLKIAGNVSPKREKWLVENDRHFITLPGIIAFLFYPGSFVFLFLAMVVVGAIGAGIEIAAYKLTSSLILCSLIAFVVAYRYSSFGYVPARSYLLFGAIALNIALIYLSNRFLAARYAGRNALTR